MRKCLWSAVAEMHEIKGCVKDRNCRGRVLRGEVPKCSSFIQYKGMIEAHPEDIGNHLCIFMKGPTKSKGESALPDYCKEKQCNGINDGCDFFVLGSK